MKKIKIGRISKGLIQADLARLVGVTPTYISKYETGQMLPKVDTLYKISRVIGYSMEELMEEYHDPEFERKLREFREKETRVQ